MGPTPSAIRKAHQAVLRLFSEDCIFPPIQGSGGQKIGYTDVWLVTDLAVTGLLFRGRTRSR